LTDPTSQSPSLKSISPIQTTWPRPTIDDKRSSYALDHDPIGVTGQRVEILFVAGEDSPGRFRRGDEDGVDYRSTTGPVAKLARSASQSFWQLLSNVTSLQ
jgi:hypothetical protein